MPPTTADTISQIFHNDCTTSTINGSDGEVLADIHEMVEKHATDSFEEAGTDLAGYRFADGSSIILYGFWDTGENYLEHCVNGDNADSELVDWLRYY